MRKPTADELAKIATDIMIAQPEISLMVLQCGAVLHEQGEDFWGPMPEGVPLELVYNLALLKMIDPSAIVALKNGVQNGQAPSEIIRELQIAKGYIPSPAAEQFKPTNPRDLLDFEA